MQIVFFEDNLQDTDVPKPIFWEKIRNFISLPSAELAQIVVKIKQGIG